MIKASGGKIINVSSRGAFRGEPEAPARKDHTMKETNERAKMISLTIENVTMQNAQRSAVLVKSGGSLDLDSCTLNNNGTAPGGTGGAVHVESGGQLTATDSVFQSNSRFSFSGSYTYCHDPDSSV